MTQLLSPAPARPRWRSALAIFALVGALFAAGAALPANAEVVGTGPGVITGTATAGDGQPVAEVQIVASSTNAGGWTLTDAAGNFELTGLPLNEAIYVSVWAQGYQAYPAQIVTLTETASTLALNISLTPLVSGVGTISGEVTADGAPLAGVQVSAYLQTNESAYATSDANGHFELTGLPDGDWTVNAFAGNQYMTIQSQQVTVSNGTQSAAVNFAFLSYPSGTSAIVGVITDSATGQPLAGVNINLSGTEVPQYGSATTNEAGEFRFDSLPAGTFYLVSYTSGYLDFAEDIQVGEGQTVIVDREFIAKNATVSGHLQLTDGTPIADTWVGAGSLDGVNWGAGETDENGNYVITGLGAITYTLSIGGIGSPYDLQERMVTAIANSNVTADFTLVPRATGSLAGTVYQASGAFTKPVCATLYSEKTKKSVAERYIDGDHYGSDEFHFENVKPGRYTVEIRDCDDDPATKFDKVYLGGSKTLKNAMYVSIAAAQDSSGNDIEFVPRSH